MMRCVVHRRGSFTNKKVVDPPLF